MPIPQLVLAEDKRRRGAFIVIDGKQRLLTLRQFAEGSSLGTGSSYEGFQKLTLSGLDVRPDLHGYNLARLEEQASKLDDLNAILNQTVRTVVVRRWPDEAFLNLVFLRLNTGSVALSPQELRQALHPGGFTDFIDDFAAESVSVRKALRIKAPDFRMRDVELLLRYCAFRRYLSEYRGNLKAFLDSTVERLNSEWKELEQEKEIRSLAEDFDLSIEAAFTIFGANAFFRWDSKANRYERRFNRALFDVLMYHFRDGYIRELAANNAGQVEDALKHLCEQDTEFVRSIQTTTKSVGATFERITKWGQALSNTLQVKLEEPVPTLESSPTSSTSG